MIAQVLPHYTIERPPAHSAELYSDLFIDSRKFLMIIRGLERIFGLEIDDEDLLGADLITYGDLVTFATRISAKQNNNPNG